MTTEDLSWAPADVDLNRPNAARVYDYYLGGGCNFDIDREFGNQMIKVLPEIREAARLNRGFLRRAVRYCAEQGIDQFLDLGAGIPTVGPTHEVASRVQPHSRVVYVDNEAVAVAHGRLLLEDNDNAAILQADLCTPQDVLRASETGRLIDFSRPVAVMLIALLHFVPENEEAARVVAQYRDVLPEGSYLILAHGTTEGQMGSRTQDAVQQYQQTSTPVYLRDRAEVQSLFDGFELVEPGLVFTPEWRPEDPDDVGDSPDRSAQLAGVGRKIG